MALSADKAVGPNTAGRLPIGVVLPTLNAIGLLPSHLATMRDWLHLVEEVVIVDSESSDGTVEMLRAELGDSRFRFFSRPRGLYQAWNYGIAQLSAPYAYVSTVGDAITADGLAHLYAVARTLDADVVVSPPEFIDEQGQRVPSLDWPVCRLVRDLDIREPVRLPELTAFGIALLAINDALLGSSASNLYRTAYLKQHPFPVEFGTGGDCAWGVANGLDARIVVTPRRMSSFRIHQKSYAASAYAVEDMLPRLDQLAAVTFAESAGSDSLRKQPDAARILGEIIAAREVIHLSQRTLAEVRKSAGWRWILHWRAWRARLRRNRARRNERHQARAFMTSVSKNES